MSKESEWVIESVKPFVLHCRPTPKMGDLEGVDVYMYDIFHFLFTEDKNEIELWF